MATSHDDDVQRFAKTYASKYDDELLALADERNTLTDAARSALDAELARRKLSVPEHEADAPADAANAPQDSLPSPEKIVVVAWFQNPRQARLAKAELDAAGMRNFMIDESLTTMHFGSSGQAGIKIAVEREDEEEARKILRSQFGESIELAENEELLQTVCPRCVSPQISYLGPAARSSQSLEYTSWRCDVCGTLWEMTEGGAPIQ